MQIDWCFIRPLDVALWYFLSNINDRRQKIQNSVRINPNILRGWGVAYFASIVKSTYVLTIITLHWCVKNISHNVNKTAKNWVNFNCFLFIEILKEYIMHDYFGWLTDRQCKLNKLKLQLKCQTNQHFWNKENWFCAVSLFV